MVKLDPLQTTINKLKEKIQKKAEELADQQEAIETKAMETNQDGHMTGADERRYERLQEKIDELQEEDETLDEILFMIDDYCTQD